MDQAVLKSQQFNKIDKNSLVTSSQDKASIGTPRKDDDEVSNSSEITITHPGVIEDMFQQMEVKVLQQMVKLTKNNEENMTNLYSNLSKKIDSQKEKVKSVVEF